MRLQRAHVESDLTLDFSAPLQGPPTVSLRGRVGVSDLAVAERGGAPLLELARLSLGLDDVQPLARRLAFGALKLEPEARAVFKREREVRFRKDRPTKGKAVRSASASSQRAKSTLEGRDGELFEALRAWRADQAKAQRIPPYVIFHDATLREMAEIRPSTLSQMAEISGVGARKLDAYGEAFLAVLNKLH